MSQTTQIRVEAMLTARQIMESAIVRRLNLHHRPREASGYEWQVDLAADRIRIRLHSILRLLEAGEESILSYEIGLDDDPCPSQHLDRNRIRQASFVFRPPQCVKRV